MTLNHTSRSIVTKCDPDLPDLGLNENLETTVELTDSVNQIKSQKLIVSSSINSGQ
jgi:hypothetical protein